VDEQQVIAQAEVDFRFEGKWRVTPRMCITSAGVQFQQYGLHHVEIYLGDELKLRFSAASPEAGSARNPLKFQIFRN